MKQKTFSIWTSQINAMHFTVKAKDLKTAKEKVMRELRGYTPDIIASDEHKDKLKFNTKVRPYLSSKEESNAQRDCNRKTESSSTSQQSKEKSRS